MPEHYFENDFKSFCEKMRKINNEQENWFLSGDVFTSTDETKQCTPEAFLATTYQVPADTLTTQVFIYLSNLLESENRVK